MGLLAILGLVLVLTSLSLETPSKYDKKRLLYPSVFSMRMHKREVASSKHKVKDEYAAANEFIEEKLVEHGQALEHLVTLVQKNEELTRKLVDKLSNSQNAEEPELPEKVEVLKYRRKNSAKSKDEEIVDDNPFVKFSQNLPKYGLLIKSLVLSNDASADPIPLVEKRPADYKPKNPYKSRH